MKSLSRILALALVASAFAACDSNPIEDDDGHEHRLTDIHRLELVMNGTAIVVVEDNDLAGGNPGRIVVEEGEETPLISLEAFDEDGDEIHLDELSDEYSLSYDEGQLDEEVAEFEQHEEERWSFHIRGNQSGTAVLQLELMHINHPDFTTPAITVEVE